MDSISNCKDLLMRLLAPLPVVADRIAIDDVVVHPIMFHTGTGCLQVSCQ
jgi:hypothetical protein